MRKSKTPNLVTIAILTAITAVFWVFFSVYRVFTGEPSPSVPAEILEPVNPTLDDAVINAMEGRIYFAPGETFTRIEIASPEASPTEAPTIAPSPSPSPTSTPTASPSVSPTP